MLLEMAATGFGARVAVQNGRDRLTYAELFAAAAAARRQIEASGAAHVGILDVNSLAVPVGLFAAAWAGLPFVPLNYRLTGDEVDALVARIAPAYLVVEPARVERLASLAGAKAVARDRFLAGLAGEEDPAADWPVDPDAVAVLLFTSGTTGAPKAAVLRNRHLVSYILGSVEFGAAGEDEATLVSVPPYHVAAMAAILSSVYAGRRIVQLASFSAEDWVETARAEKVTHAFVVPTMLARIVDVLESERRGASEPARALLRRRQDAAAGDRARDAAAVRRRFHERLRAHRDELDDLAARPRGPPGGRREHDPAVRRRLASVGRALPGVEIEVRDEDGKQAAPGRAGRDPRARRAGLGRVPGPRHGARRGGLVPDPRRRISRPRGLPLRRPAASTT